MRLNKRLKYLHNKGHVQWKEKDNPQNAKKFLQMKIPTGICLYHIQTTPHNNIKIQTLQYKISQGSLCTFSKEGVEMAVMHMKRCLASLILRERRISCPRGIIDQNDRLRKSTAINSAEGVKRRKPSHYGWECKWIHPLGENIMEVF